MAQLLHHRGAMYSQLANSRCDDRRAGLWDSSNRMVGYYHRNSRCFVLCLAIAEQVPGVSSFPLFQEHLFQHVRQVWNPNNLPWPLVLEEDMESSE